MNWPTFHLLFEPDDLFIGVFNDRKKRRTYFVFLTLGIVMEWPTPPKVITLEPTGWVHTPIKRTLIVAFNFAQAREYALHHKLRCPDWVYASEDYHLRGYRDVDVVKLPEWERGKSRGFRDLIKRLENPL